MSRSRSFRISTLDGCLRKKTCAPPAEWLNVCRVLRKDGNDSFRKRALAADIRERSDHVSLVWESLRCRVDALRFDL